MYKKNKFNLGYKNTCKIIPFKNYLFENKGAMIFFLKSILILVAFTVCAAQTSVANEKSKWGYRDPNELAPEEWSTKYPLCGGTKQSPINVVTRNTEYDSKMLPISIEYNADIARLDEKWEITNNGHSILLESNKKHTFVFNSVVYEFSQMHFHWRGSEHRIDNRNFAGELHLVHTNLNSTQGYCVLGFLLEVIY